MTGSALTHDGTPRARPTHTRHTHARSLHTLPRGPGRAAWPGSGLQQPVRRPLTQHGRGRGGGPRAAWEGTSVGGTPRSAAGVTPLLAASRSRNCGHREAIPPATLIINCNLWTKRLGESLRQVLRDRELASVPGHQLQNSEPAALFRAGTIRQPRPQQDRGHALGLTNPATGQGSLGPRGT